MSVRTPDPFPSDDQPERPNPDIAWLDDAELARIRGRVPLVYVEVVPARVNGLGQVTEFGVLLRANELGEITRSIVSGRVRFGETIREALYRHLENDLGPIAFPQLPPSLLPATVAEYFPIPGVSPFVDPRQHAVSLVYVVPVTGTCEPRQDALEITWIALDGGSISELAAEMEGGRGLVVQRALASVGALQ